MGPDSISLQWTKKRLSVRRVLISLLGLEGDEKLSIRRRAGMAKATN